jgi:hypothetical protein
MSCFRYQFLPLGEALGAAFAAGRLPILPSDVEGDWSWAHLEAPGQKEPPIYLLSAEAEAEKHVHFCISSR